MAGTLDVESRDDLVWSCRRDFLPDCQRILILC